jgi:hypothetical protein
MEPHARSAFLVRTCRATLTLSLLGLVIAGQVGCHHRRSALRPRLGRPIITSGCATCGGATPGCSSCGLPGSTRILGAEPAYDDGPVIENAAPRPFGDADLGEPAPGDPEILPSRGAAPATPPSSGRAAEPFLDLESRGDRGLPPEASGEPETRMRPRNAAPTNSTRETWPSAPAKSGGLFDDGPVLEPPQAASASRSSRKVGAPTRRPVYRRDLEARVNDPGDLFTPPRADRPWRYIVLHHSAHDAGSLAQIDRDHRERLGTSGCGYHFVVGNGSESPDGQIEVARRWSEQRGGQHCRDSRVADINEYGIGICLIGDVDAKAPTAEQVESTRLLIAYLKERYDIPDGNVVTHDVVAKSAAACPGRNFPTQAILGRPKAMARQASFAGH